MSSWGGTTLPTMLLLISALSSAGLGALVLYRNPHRTANRLFAVLTTTIGLWALGVLTIIHCHTPETAALAMKVTFVIAGFLPANFYAFICVFPHQRFTGLKPVLGLLYLSGIVIAGLVNTELYLKEVIVSPDAPPQAVYGPLFFSYSGLVVFAMVFSFANLFRKLIQSSGIARRQIEHVIGGIFLSTGLATATNVVAPALGIQNTEQYGPCFMVLMTAIFAYSMVRYHLLDILYLLSRTTVYATVTLSVVATFMGTISVVHLISSSAGDSRLITTALSALIIALLIQPLKERVQLLADRLVLYRRYDAKGLIERISSKVVQSVQLDELLETMADDLKSTVGAKKVRVLLVSEKDPGTVIIEHSTDPNEIGQRDSSLEYLLEYVGHSAEPLSLEELIHTQPRPELARVSTHLAALDAYLLVPLKSKSGLIGMIVLGEKTSKDMYTQEDIRTFATLSGPVAAAIENARLYRKLEELNMHTERIMSNMRAGVVSVDNEGHITTVNQEACEMLGPLAAGQDIESIESKVRKLLDRTLEEQHGISEIETVITGPDGDLIPIAMSTSAFVTADDQMIGAMVLIFNMSQIKRLESTVQRADRLTSIGTMAAGMAHEIKNPLVSIKTFTQLLLDRFNDDDFRKTFAEVVPPEVERIDTIVTRLLDFARPKPVLFASIYLPDVVDDVLALVENQIRKAGAEVHVEYPPERKNITGDEQQLHQLFLNLLLNALDSVKERDERRLSIKLHYGRTHMKLASQDDLLDVPCARVLISDTGCGIPVANMNQLFTPFFTTKEHGSGLGLSVVHGIVTEHRGDIDVTSAPDVGTTFIITLPLADAPEPAEKAVR